jgi:hypothetical protein
MSEWEDRLIIVAGVVTEAQQGFDGSIILLVSNADGRGGVGHYASGRG